jgi:hypothetical protein
MGVKHGLLLTTECRKYFHLNGGDRKTRKDCKMKGFMARIHGQISGTSDSA